MITFSRLLCSVLVLWITVPTTVVQAQTSKEITVKVNVKGKNFIGKPLVWDGKEMVLLRRDGRMSILPVRSHDDYRKVSDSFKPKSPDSIRSQLLKEFRGKYQVSTTKNFIVVHPYGDANVWANPFEELFQRFKNYFVSRGISLEEPPFPMVAVVLKSRGEFDRFLKNYHDYDPSVLGYYSPRSNRIITFDQNKGKSRDQSWFFSADTIVHEATHQTAFNAGLHNRFGPVPRWMSEGLAMMFEAPGVNNSNYFSRQSTRVNRGRLLQLRQMYKKNQTDGAIPSLVVSDRLFRSKPDLAYAMSWGLTFYLAENHPQEYVQMLRKDGAREDFKGYGNRERARDFLKLYKMDMSELEVRAKKFIMELEIPAAR